MRFAPVVLVDALPRVFPVVEDLAAEQMAANAPDVTVLAGLVQMLVTRHEIVEALHLERQVIQSRRRRLEA